ncbi:LTA synthase family protein [Alkalicella caledoniensis]|uniref:LTA synthase family protein n=1 Tax=Alkalicella caledoniensis TaxID=2731377 RepID=A0A7G9W6A1_ALKCA|nr:LTA synthase family protein [Alkalicella caledoniensis]QNO14213.1 LTA synthase family protein [Alkalicella caledoniensis]
MLEKLFKSGVTKYLIAISAGVFLKLFALHSTMGIGDIFRVTFKNYLIVMAIMCLTCIISQRNRIRAMLIVNILISALLFIDAVYYGHFYTLIRAHSIYQAGQVRHVSNSIAALLNPLYFLYFIDSIVIFIYLFKDKAVIIKSTPKQRLATAVTLVLLISMITGMNLNLSKKTNGYFTPHNTGVINFHLYDVAGYVRKASLKTEHVQALAKFIEPEQNGIKYFGVAEGKNVFVIQAESVQNFVINTKINGQEITPNLNKLVDNESIYFDRYYEQIGWGNTSDAEFISHNGFYASRRVFSYKAYEGIDFITLPINLKDKGYNTIAFHGNEGDFWDREKAYPSQGLDEYISIEDLEVDEELGLGLSDQSFFRQSMDFIKELHQPFYSFLITLTSHHPFIIPEDLKELNVGEQYEGTSLEDYLQTVRYLDTQIGEFIQALKDENLYDNSIIVVYGDHKGLDYRYAEANEHITNLIGREYQVQEMYRVPFIVHMPGSGLKETISTVGGQVDFYPTMANLLGIELRSDSVLGKDLLNTEKGFAAIQNHVAQGSFIDDNIVFVMSEDGIFENSDAWDLKTGEPLDLELAREGYERAVAELKLSEYILQNNLVPLVHEKGIKGALEQE